MITLSSFAPFVRGCTFDGEKGGFVVPLTAGRNIDTLKKFPTALSVRGGGNKKDIEQNIAEAFRQHRSEGNPEYLIIEGLGAVAIGETFEEAAARAIGEDDEDTHARDASAKTGTSPEAGTTTGGSVGQAGSSSAAAVYGRNRVVRNKIALVTGGAQGFGEGLVREMAAAGAVVFVADLNTEGAEQLAEELNAHHGRTAALPVKVNVADEESVREMFETVASKTGGIDICISNAGVLKAGSVKELGLKDFRFVTDVNYIGYFLCAKYASPLMAGQAEGARESGAGIYFSDVIQINSKSGLEGSNKNGAYAGGKFGGIGLTQSFAKELVSDCIKVNSICPGNFFDGPLWSDPDRGLFVQYLRAGKVPGAESIADVKRFYESKVPMNRGCTVQDVVKAVYYVIDQKYETGQAVPVTGGQVMLK